MEKWKRIDDRYSVSTHGRIYSNYGNGCYQGAKTGDGKYWYTTLSDEDGKYKGHRIHRLVAKAFIPNPLDLPMINHIDGNGLNNHVSNLEWVSPQGNVTHAIATGLWLPGEKGERHPGAKFLNRDIMKAVRLYKAGATIKEAGANIGMRSLNDVLHGRTRTDMTGITESIVRIAPPKVPHAKDSWWKSGASYKPTVMTKDGETLCFLSNRFAAEFFNTRISHVSDTVAKRSGKTKMYGWTVSFAPFVS